MVVHFSGHGDESGAGPVWPGAGGSAACNASHYDDAGPLTPTIFLELLRLERAHIMCVFLNACMQQGVGEGLRGVGVEWVVCWEGRVSDDTARKFALEFYECINTKGRERDYMYAFERARVICRQEGSLRTGFTSLLSRSPL